MMDRNFDGSPLLRIEDVMALLRLGRTTIYDYVKKGEFPAPIKLGPRRSVWPQSEILQWIAQQSQERKGGAPMLHQL